MRYLLARLTGYAQTVLGQPGDFATYLDGYAITHIWGSDHSAYRHEVSGRADFAALRNRIGARCCSCRPAPARTTICRTRAS